MNHTITNDVKCAICGISRSHHTYNILHNFQEHILDKHVSAEEFRSNIIPNTNVQIINSNPCRVCGLLPNYHMCNHAYQPTFQGVFLPHINHQSYSPQKEYQGIISKSYYKNYENLIETKTQKHL
jgi:hypothetical protein